MPESTTERKYKFSEIFRSIQGEGHYTGVPTMWIRWFICNLECRGFGQINPADPSTYKEVGNDIDLSGVKKIQDLPVFKYGCDSAYSVSKRYKDIVPEGTAADICDQITDLMRNDVNPDGLFAHPHSKQAQHLCMTGGEPMIKNNQLAQIAVIHEFARRNNFPTHITVETNGTKAPMPELVELIENFYTGNQYGGVAGHTEWFWSVSPKLMHTSGEPFKRTIKPDVVLQMQELSPHGQLKFVVRNHPDAWDELEERVQQFREAGVRFPIWCMPVGATEEDQSNDDTREVVAETIRRGYNVSARLQAYIWGNTIGV